MEDGFTSGLALGESRNNGNMWDNGMGLFGIIALLAFANGGFGWGGGRFDGSLAGNDALFSNAIQTNTLEASANARQMCADFNNTNSNIVNGNYQTQGIVQNGFANITRDLGTASTGIVQAVRNNRDFISNKIDGLASAQVDGFYATQNAINGMGQKILDTIAQNKIDTLQAQVNELKTQNMFCGIPRINPYGYGVYQYPNGCGCNCGV